MFPTLSPREIEVAKLVALGYSDKWIAALLKVSRQTVAVHVANVAEKLGIERGSTNTNTRVLITNSVWKRAEWYEGVKKTRHDYQRKENDSVY